MGYSSTGIMHQTFFGFIYIYISFLIKKIIFFFSKDRTAKYKRYSAFSMLSRFFSWVFVVYVLYFMYVHVVSVCTYTKQKKGES